MIIRLTVNDNDFTPRLASYLNNLYYNINCDISDVIERFESDSITRKILNPNSSPIWCDKYIEFITERIKQSFSHYVNNDEYLVSSLKVDILKSFEDKWENGTAVYWLQHSGRVIEQ